MSVRTRFAPSPTGFLHIGSARTALFNWAFARRHGGVHVLRIEDTDRERSTPESEAAVLEGLEWLGIDWDEGPLRQSERGDRHAAAIDELLDRDRAYRCTCAPEDLETRRQEWIARGDKWTYDGRCAAAGYGADCGTHTVRLRVAPEGKLGWDDLVFGPSGQDAAEIGDRIIRRSDGSPLYHLAVVVDDIDMRIDHVIRGGDHLNNTSFQIALYRALDAEPPRFAHVPLIVNASGKKLSKRKDPVSVQQFREDGYLADAMCNWLARLGWSHGDQELFTRDEIAALFDLANVQRSPAQADTDKLQWINQSRIRELPGDELIRALAPFLGCDADTAPPGLPDLVDLLRERSKTLAEMAERARFLLIADDDLAYEEKAAKKHLTARAAPLLDDLHGALSDLATWDDAALESAFEAVCARADVKLGKLAQPVRVAVTGSSASPGIYETLRILGRERTLRRLARASARIGRA